MGLGTKMYRFNECLTCIEGVIVSRKGMGIHVIGTSFMCHMATLPETNIAPENGPLQKEIPIGNHHF